MNTQDQEIQSELIVGLVGAVGTEIKQVVELLNERLGLAGYNVQTIKVSKEVIHLLHPIEYDSNNPVDRIGKSMDAGNSAREDCQDNAVLANGVSTLIYRERPKYDGKSIPHIRKAFIVDSLKRPEEVSRLREIYPGGFVLVGVHSEQARRKENLTNNLGIAKEDADELIKRDGEEGQVPHGQRLNKTFHLADFFVRITENRERLRNDVQRMVEIWFGQPFLTPTFDEFAMFMAQSAALRSADLSRQVGAVIAKDKMILATGANDCPKFGGGLYWPDRDENERISDIENGRDFKREEDSNRIEQLGIIEEILQNCRQSGMDVDNTNKIQKVLEKSRLTDITEFGRVVHAEMEAMLACGRMGISALGSTLYSTTFPCHNCAKHIVASGIERVVYIEPYPKSKAIEFHDDSITTNPGSTESKVRFEPFVGIGPRKYFDLFSMHGGSSYPLVRKDKETGKSTVWAIEKAKLRLKMLPDSYLGFELEAAEKFKKTLKQHGVSNES